MLCAHLDATIEKTSSKSQICLLCSCAFLVYDFQIGSPWAGFSVQDFSFLSKEMFRLHPPHFH